MGKKIYKTTKEKVIDFIIGGLLATPFILVAIFTLNKSAKTDFLTYMPSMRALITLCVIVLAFLCAVLSGVFLWKRAKFIGIGLLFFVLPAMIFGLFVALVLGACGLMMGR